jgi:amino acid transporter
MGTVLVIHSLLRWVFVILAIAVIVKFAIGWLQNKEFKPMDRGLLAGLTGTVDLQLVIGLILLIGYGTYTRHQLEHTFTMILALLLLHIMPHRWKESPSAIRFRNNLAVVMVALILIVLGVIVLPGNRWAI